MSKKDKRPAVAYIPQPTKKPKFHSDPHLRGAPLSWRFSHGDRGGPFAWSRIDAADALRVVERLAALETMDERTIRETGSHPIGLDSLCKEAKDRLVEIRHDDLEEVFSIRLSGEERVICIHYGSVMRVLWWDPKHQVCPWRLKHT